MCVLSTCHCLSGSCSGQEVPESFTLDGVVVVADSPQLDNSTSSDATPRLRRQLQRGGNFVLYHDYFATAPDSTLGFIASGGSMSVSGTTAGANIESGEPLLQASV